MTTRKQMSANIPRQILFAMIAAAVMLLPATQALANTAANAQIENRATLTYDDGTGVNRTDTAEVTVTVDHVAGAPVLSTPADASAVYSAANATLAFNYTITAGGNGPDTYNLTSTTAATNTAGESVAFAIGATAVTSIDLGASVTVTGSTTTALRVPVDGTADDIINGIATGDTVIVNGESRVVAAITGEATTGFVNIPLVTALPAAPAAGVSVFEQGTFTMTVSSGTRSAAGTDVVVTATTTAASAASATATASDAVVATFTSGNATLAKYVRNVTNANGTTTAHPFTINGINTTFYANEVAAGGAGVTGVTGDVLEYLLVVENTGSMDVTACSIADLLPTEFVTMAPGGYGGHEVMYQVGPAGTPVYYSSGADTDQATLSGSTLTVNVGTGATSALGGSLASGETVYVLYRVNIN